MGYTVYVEKVFNLLDNGNLEWEEVVGMCLEYMADRLYERVKEKKYLKKTTQRDNLQLDDNGILKKHR